MQLCSLPKQAPFAQVPVLLMHKAAGSNPPASPNFNSIPELNRDGPQHPVHSRSSGKVAACAMKRARFLDAVRALVVVVVVAVTTVAQADSVVEELQKNGLPVGLLPSSVRSYSMGKDGAFWVSLEAPCYAKIEDQLVYYGPNITGTLKFGTISSLDGIKTKQLFVWLPVTGIYVDVPATPYIYFKVGVLTKRLSLATFETPPKCSSHALKTGDHMPSWDSLKSGSLLGDSFTDTSHQFVHLCTLHYNLQSHRTCERHMLSTMDLEAYDQGRRYSDDIDDASAYFMCSETSEMVVLYVCMYVCITGFLSECYLFLFYKRAQDVNCDIYFWSVTAVQIPDSL